MARRKAVVGEAGETVQEASAGAEMPAARSNGEDPAQRLADVARRCLETEELLDRLHEERGALMVELAGLGWTEARLAWVLRVSQPRAHQLIKEQQGRAT